MIPLPLIAYIPVAAWESPSMERLFPATWMAYGPCPCCQSFGVEAVGDVWPYEIEAVLREHAAECPGLQRLAEAPALRA